MNRADYSVATLCHTLHGFSFAAVLRDIGLPQTELLFFNLRVEIGQILFILAVALTVTGLAKLAGRTRRELFDHRSTALMGSYLIGTVASFWLLQRMDGG